MYIRKSSRLYKGKTYTNYVLVESVLTPKGPRQKTICSLGDLSPRRREEWLKLARKIEDALVVRARLCDDAQSVDRALVGACDARLDQAHGARRHSRRRLRWARGRPAL